LKSSNLKKQWRVLGAALSLTTLPVLASAQANSEKKDSDLLVLSPFVVSTSSDQGYEANSSLAGTGLNTKLTDLGASVSVVTKKFMEDTGSKNLSDILVYQTNMEVTGFGGNLSGATPVLGGITLEPSLTNKATSTRVRGLAEATQARDFFRTVIPMDSYNTDRVEINRGANALLFGVGSPAGIINTSTSAAELYKSFGKVEVSGGSYGSWRTSADYNLVLKKDELALRVAGVHDDEQFQQNYAYSNTKRYFGAGTWDVAALRNRGILTSTILRASFESGEITSNNPRVLPPSDRISMWFDDSIPADIKAAGAVAKATYDPTTGSPSTLPQYLSLGTIQNVNRSPTFVFQDYNATSPRDNIQGDGTTPVLGRAFVSNNVYFPNSNLTYTAQQAYVREASRARLELKVPDQEFYTAENMANSSIFDFFDNAIGGPNSIGKSHLQAFDASLQQLFLKSTLGFEAAFNQQRWRENLQSLFSETQPYISIDVNTKMWTGEVNPNFGRPFISTSGGASWNEQEVETSRAKLFYELDLEKKLGGILGKHVFSALAQREVLTTETHGGGSLWYTPDTWVNGNSQSRAAATGKLPVVWVYLGPSLAGLSSASGANIPDVQANLLNFQTEVNGKGVVLTRTPAPSTAVAKQAQYTPFYTTINLQRDNEQVTNTATQATLNERTLDSQAFSMQSNWLWDHLVSTVGWRKEESSIKGINAPSISNGEGYVLISDPSFTLDNPAIVPQEFDRTLFAWSTVAKMPEKWLRRVPAVSAFNAFYGESENFNPATGRTVDPFGVPIAPPSGITTEKGIYVETFHGRLTARLNFFKTTQTGSPNSTVGGLASALITLQNSAYNAVKNGWTPDGGNGLPVGYVPPPQALLDLFNWKVNNGTPSSSNPGVTDTSDFVTKGEELEVMFRPARGLSFVLNVSKQESVRSNTGDAIRKLLFETPTASGKPVATEWLSAWTYNIPTVQASIVDIGKVGAANLFGTNFQRNVLNVFNTAVSGDGAPAQELRKWHANFVGNYDFQQGKLQGFSIGSGVRWMSKAAIGYPVATFEGDLSPSDGIDEVSDIRISDVRHPIYGPAETRFDGWISYQTKILHGRVGLRVSLNVRNIGVHDELVPVVANPNGTIPVWSIAEGAKYTLSAKLSF
jgi:outer membrane receptor protein involved in Fe transport